MLTRLPRSLHTAGYPPRTRLIPNEASPIIQVENFSDPDEPTLEYRCRLTSKAGAKLEIVYDTVKMFAGGVQVRVEPPGAGVSATTDDGAGVVRIECASAGELVDVVITRR